MASWEHPHPSSYNVCSIRDRRIFISHYLKHLGDDAVSKWDNHLKMAFETIMESLKEKGLTQASHHWLEHEADHMAWQKLFSELGIEPAKWPFIVNHDAANKIAEGVSPTYQKWRLDRGLPIHDTVHDDGHKKPTKLSLAQRKIVWENDPNYPRDTEAPITGPFQIAMPLWIDVYNLVLGQDDHLLHAINNEIVPPHLAVSWHNDDEGCITLVVGFSPTTCVSPADEAVDRSIRYLWQNVVDWAIETYHGGTMTLATFLRVGKAMPLADNDDYHTRGITDMTSELYHEIQSDPMYFMAQAQKNRDFIAECRAEVLEITQKPLGEAKAELSRWVSDGGSQSDERLAAAREIWVSSTTDERTIQEAVIWALGPHTMAAS
ncbi:hypothetical protein H9Q74_000012 [Fusarium xylarioides]|nr:hypothetical protein H9Q71_000174 [Fusarium xylarioides]KAG5829859.1 hypothetical protein H9Q74_000012 [Fusarium xylarioides]